MMKRCKKLTSILALSLITLFFCVPVRATTADLYAVSLQTHNIYQINSSTGSITSFPSLFPSNAIASDDRYLYYWNADKVTQRGIVKWDPWTNTSTLINTTEVSEENACARSDGTLWVLDRTNSYDPTLNNGAGGFLGDDTRYLYQVDKNTGARTVYATLPDVGGYAAGDIAWGPDSKLYISTHNTFWGYDTVDNYIWNPATGNISKMGGVLHAGLAWIGDNLYGSRTLDDNLTGAIFQLNPADFSEIRQIAVMPAGVSIGDLSSGVVPEPATICILGLGAAFLRRQVRSRTKTCT
jgi:hypothetical protein